MNLLDIGVIVIFAGCIFYGYKKGFVLTLYLLCGRLASLMLAWKVYPFVNKLFTNTEFVYNFVYRLVETGLDLDSLVASESMRAQNELISALNLPEFITQSLQAGNNPVLYELFKAANINDYIYAYLTMLCINALSLIVTFCVISAILHAVLKSINIITRLPVIHGINAVGGIAAGAVQGLLAVWIAGVVVVMLISSGLAPTLGDMLGESMIAYRFLENNIILNLIHI